MAGPLLLMTLYLKPKTPTIIKLVSKREQGMNEQLLKTELMFYRLRKKFKKSRGGVATTPAALYVWGLIDECIN